MYCEIGQFHHLICHKSPVADKQPCIEHHKPHTFLPTMFWVIICLLCLTFAQSAPLVSQYNTAFAKLNTTKIHCSNASSLPLCNKPSSYPTAVIIKTAILRQTEMEDMISEECNTITKKCPKRSIKDYYRSRPNTEKVEAKKKRKQCEVINQIFNRRFKQAARVANCNNDFGRSCGMKTYFCKRLLLVFTIIGIIIYVLWKKLNLGTFILPSSCSCMISKSSTVQVTDV